MKLQWKFRQQGWSFTCFVLTLFLISSFISLLSLIIAYYLGSSIDISCSRQPGTSIQWHGDTPSLLVGHLAAVVFNTIVSCLLFIPAAVLHTSSTYRTPASLCRFTSFIISSASLFHQPICLIRVFLLLLLRAAPLHSRNLPVESKHLRLSDKTLSVLSDVINTFFTSFTCLSWLNYWGC